MGVFLGITRDDPHDDILVTHVLHAMTINSFAPQLWYQGTKLCDSHVTLDTKE